MDMPRIKAVTPQAGTMLDIEWQNGTRSSVNLIGWIATGGDLLAPLKSEEVWKTATVEDFGATIEWARDDLGSEDLASDAYHLSQIAEDQRSYTGEDLAKWQEELGLSNNEAADLVGVSLRTWENYKAGQDISDAIKIILCASRRDPLIMHAHYRPRTAGRPRVSSSI